MKYTISLILLLALLAGCQTETETPDAVSSETDDPQKGSSEFSFGMVNDSLVVEGTNTSYLYTYYPRNNEKIPLVVRAERFYQARDLDLPYPSDFKLEAFDMESGELRSKWNSDIRGSSIGFNFYTLMLQKSGELEDTYECYSLESGERLMSFTYDHLELIVPNVLDKRLLGFLSRNGQGAGMQAFENDPQLYGIITYCSNRERIDQLALRVRDEATLEKILEYSPDMVWYSERDGDKLIRNDKRLLLWELDENYGTEDLGGMSVRFTVWVGDYSNQLAFDIPLVEDRLDLSAATYDTGIFELVPM